MKKISAVLIATSLLVACGDSTSSTDSTNIVTTTAATSAKVAATFEYTITVGENTGNDVVISVVQGQTVTLKVVNPNNHDDIHLHGYDLTSGALEKGQTGTMTFTATELGDFEIESHETEEVVSILRVTAP